MIRLEVYSMGNTPIKDPRDEVKLASEIRFTTFYPGGVYGTLHAKVPRRVAEWWDLSGAQRLVAREGLQIVWEGWIDNLRNALSSNGGKVDVTATGAWGTYAMRRRMNKPWADTRIGNDIWKDEVTGTFWDKFKVDHNKRLYFEPKQGVTYATNDVAYLRYDAPPGQTVKRITFNYDFQEAVQAWGLTLYNITSALAVWNQTVSGAGSRDETLATPTSALYFYFSSGAAQTGIGDGTIYGKITNVVLYTETGSVNLTEIAKDIRAAITDINSTDSYIGSNTLSLVPFYTNGYDRISDILAQAAGYGDTSFNPWAAYFDHSEKAPTPDGKPVIVVEQQPATSGNDYLVQFQEIDVSLGDISYEINYDQIWNYIVVEYEDAFFGGVKHWKTPDDDATLKDTTSIGKYGQRDLVLSVNTTDSTKAIQWGKRYLAQYKNPIFRMTSPLVVAGAIGTAQGNRVPVSYVRAGKRLKINDFFGTDVTFLISNTDYSDGKVTIYAGDGGILV